MGGFPPVAIAYLPTTFGRPYMNSDAHEQSWGLACLSSHTPIGLLWMQVSGLHNIETRYRHIYKVSSLIVAAVATRHYTLVWNARTPSGVPI